MPRLLLFALLAAPARAIVLPIAPYTPQGVQLPGLFVAAAQEAPQMAEGATTAALIGGVVAILTAGIPVLFMVGNDDKKGSAEKLAGLERGVGAVEDMDMDLDSIMDVVDAADEEPPRSGTI